MTETYRSSRLRLEKDLCCQAQPKRQWPLSISYALPWPDCYQKRTLVSQRVSRSGKSTILFVPKRAWFSNMFCRRRKNQCTHRRPRLLPAQPVRIPPSRSLRTRWRFHCWEPGHRRPYLQSRVCRGRLHCGLRRLPNRSSHYDAHTDRRLPRRL